jgi:hypothetical protein
MIRSTTLDRSRFAITTVALSLALLPAVAAAQPTAPAHNSTTWGELFKAARDLVKSGDWDAGCPKFEASFALNPIASTLMNVARCHDHQGKLSVALSDYERALILNRETSNEGRRKELDAVGTTERDTLRPRVPKLRILAPGAPPGLVVECGGQMIVPAAFGGALPVDPGEIAIKASAPGYVTDARTVVLKEGTTAEVVIVLAKDPAQVTDLTVSDAIQPWRTLDSIPTWTWATGGAGVVLEAVAVGFGVDAAAAKRTIHDPSKCTYDGSSDKFVCNGMTQAEVDDLNARKNRGFPLAIALGSAGALALGATVLGIATARPGAWKKKAVRWTPDAWIGPSGGGVGVKGVY